MRTHIPALFLACCLLVTAPAQAQTNPTPASCGLPTGGTIVTSVTYTLNADCTQTATLEVTSSATLTIAGAGHTINAEALTSVDSVILATGGSDLTLGNVTFTGGGRKVRGVVQTRGSGSVSISDVTLDGFEGTALYLSGGRTVTLTRVLIQNGLGTYNNLYTFGSGLYLLNAPTVTVTDMVIRDTYNGNAAISLINNVSLTLNGCLTFDRIWPQQTSIQPDSNSTLSDNSTGRCSGTIGNGDSAVLDVPAPAVAACGLPREGFIAASATYDLISNCTLAGSLWWPTGVNVTINGNGHTIRTAGTRVIRLYPAGDFTTRDTRFEGFRYGAIYAVLRSTLTFNNVMFRNNGGPVYILGNTANFTRVAFFDHYLRDSSVQASILQIQTGSQVTVQNAVIRRNNNPNSLVYMRDAATLLTFAGCLTRENNNVDTINENLGTATDNSSGDCPEDLIVDPGPVITSFGSGPTARDLPSNCFQRLGAIGIICRMEGDPDPVIEVWGITEDSQGYFLLRVNQRQIDAIPVGHVTGTADGRVAVRVWQDRNVTVLMGPSPGGKVHHVTLEGHLYGHVIGTIDTFGGPPGPVASTALDPVPSAGSASSVDVLPPRADGSIVHVVQVGDTVFTIALAYGVLQRDIVERNQLANNGDLIFPGQELIIRDAT